MNKVENQTKKTMKYIKLTGFNVPEYIPASNFEEFQDVYIYFDYNGYAESIEDAENLNDDEISKLTRQGYVFYDYVKIYSYWNGHNWRSIVLSEDNSHEWEEIELTEREKTEQEEAFETKFKQKYVGDHCLAVTTEKGEDLFLTITRFVGDVSYFDSGVIA